MFMFLGLVLLIAFIGPISDQLSSAQDVDNLNCEGYTDWDATATSNKSYNASVGEKSSLACTAIDLYLPYIIIVVLIGSVTRLLYGGAQQQQQQYGGY